MADGAFTDRDQSALWRTQSSVAEEHPEGGGVGGGGAGILMKELSPVHQIILSL